jgi:Fuc2NAc and GlcNAc transferase
MLSIIPLCTSVFLLFILSAYGTRKFSNLAISKGLLDIPNARSSHDIPTPKGGGIVFMTLWVLIQILGYGLGMWGNIELLLFLPGALMLALLGAWDDTHAISSKFRFLIQCLAAGFCLSISLWMVFPGWFWVIIGMPVLLITLVWSINLFNFMDGLDGIAAVEAVFVLGMGGVVCWVYGHPSLAMIAWSMVCVVLGFLTVNWPKASIFMGGVGSYPLGFLIGALAWVSAWVYGIPFILWIILYGVFGFDATVTLLRRMYYKQVWTEAHRSHAYQRLHQAGFSHQQVLFCVIALNALLSAIVLVIVFKPEWTVVGFVLAMGLLLGAYAWVEYLNPMQKKIR